MKFIKKSKSKQQLTAQCSKCGYKASNNISGSIASWFFHEQLCNCTKNLSPPKLIADQLNSSPENSIKVSNENRVDLGPQYEALEIIGQGGMGTVYKAIDKSNDQIVAIKVLNDSLAANQNVLKRFEQEALSVQKLNHPNIVTVREFGQTADAIPYIVMDYVEGINLARLIKNCGHLSICDLVNITFQIGEAISYAHRQGIIHRDLKPSNIIVCATDSGFAVKVVDFGIAKAISNPELDEADLTQTGDIVGSPAYMSPEQCLGEKVDERSDIYSLGCVMYEALTGRNPFLSKNPVQAIVKQVEAEAEPFEIEFSHLHITKAMEKIVLKCLQKDPANRYQSALYLEKDLRKLGKQPAYIVRRLTATIVDLMLITLACFNIPPTLLPSSYLLYGFSALIIIYYAGFESWLHFTPGKYLFNLRVIGKHNRPISLVNSVLRLSILLITFVVGFFSIAMIIFGAYSGIFHSELDVSILFPMSLIGSMLAYWIPTAISENKQSPIDKIFDRSVNSPSYLLENKPTKQLPQPLHDHKDQYSLS